MQFLEDPIIRFIDSVSNGPIMRGSSFHIIVDQHWGGRGGSRDWLRRSWESDPYCSSWLIWWSRIHLKRRNKHVTVTPSHCPHGVGGGGGIMCALTASCASFASRLFMFVYSRATGLALITDPRPHIRMTSLEPWRGGVKIHHTSWNVALFIFDLPVYYLRESFFHLSNTPWSPTDYLNSLIGSWFPW